MKRTNTFEVRPLSKSDEARLQDAIDATASFWNELTYARRQRFFDEQNIWEARVSQAVQRPARRCRRPDGDTKNNAA